jgi:hypothetical protein
MKATEYKALAAAREQMPPATEKTIANFRKSAHAAKMSLQHDVSVRRSAGPWT